MFRHHGAEQHGATQGGQHVAGLHDEGGWRVLFQPLQRREQLGEHILLLAQFRQQAGALGCELLQLGFAGGHQRLLRLDRLGDGAELLGHPVLRVDGGGDFVGDAGFSRLGILDLALDELQLLLLLGTRSTALRRKRQHREGYDQGGPPHGKWLGRWTGRHSNRAFGFTFR